MKNKKRNINYKKIILCLIILIVAIIVIHTVKNCIIINKLFSKQQRLKQTKNYYFVSEYYTDYDGNDKAIIKHYHKDGISMLILNDGNIINWYNENTKENIVIDKKSKEAISNTSEYFLANEIPIYVDKSINKFFKYIFINISDCKINNENCYKIKNGKQVVYISKKDGLVLKVENNVNKDKLEITEYKNWKLNELKENDLNKPDLTGFTINDR